MLSRSAFAAIVAGVLAAGCVVAPVTTESYDPDCRVVTHHMSLQPVQVAQVLQCNDKACAAVVLGVTAVSTLVSGSIVVIGNVAYWAEHRADCAVPPPPAASA